MDNPPHRSLPAGPVAVEIDAPAALVFQMLAAVGQGAQRPGERAEVLERDGERMVADFWTPVLLPLGRTATARTREAVRLVPPGVIEYEHLDGPLRGLRETIAVAALGPGRCRVEYAGRFPSSGVLQRLLFRLSGRRAVERAVRDHLTDLRPRAEDRARRSRVFRLDGD